LLFDIAKTKPDQIARIVLEKHQTGADTKYPQRADTGD
jgi:hypothetical protein